MENYGYATLEENRDILYVKFIVLKILASSIYGAGALPLITIEIIINSFLAAEPCWYPEVLLGCLRQVYTPLKALKPPSTIIVVPMCRIRWVGMVHQTERFTAEFTYLCDENGL